MSIFFINGYNYLTKIFLEVTLYMLLFSLGTSPFKPLRHSMPSSSHLALFVSLSTSLTLSDSSQFSSSLHHNWKLMKNTKQMMLSEGIKSTGTTSRDIESNADKGKEPLESRPLKPDCAFYVKAGYCKYGDTCRFNHPPREMVIWFFNLFLLIRIIDLLSIF